MNRKKLIEATSGGRGDPWPRRERRSLCRWSTIPHLMQICFRPRRPKRRSASVSSRRISADTRWNTWGNQRRTQTRTQSPSLPLVLIGRSAEI